MHVLVRLALLASILFLGACASTPGPRTGALVVVDTAPLATSVTVLDYVEQRCAGDVCDPERCPRHQRVVTGTRVVPVTKEQAKQLRRVKGVTDLGERARVLKLLGPVALGGLGIIDASGVYTPPGGGWTDNGSTVTVTTAGDGVGVGAGVVAATETLDVTGNATRHTISLTAGTGGGITITGAVNYGIEGVDIGADSPGNAHMLTVTGDSTNKRISLTAGPGGFVNLSDNNAIATLKLDDTAGTIVATKFMSAGVVESVTAGSGAPNVLLGNESGLVIDNTGATAEVYNTLPSAVAGLHFYGKVTDGDGLRFTAAAGDTIRIRGLVTAAAGYVKCVAVASGPAATGATIHLVAVNATEWIADECQGWWSDGTNSIVGQGVTDWLAYTPTSSWVANTTMTGYWRRVGDSMEVSVKAALTGAPTTATLTFTLPWTIDTAKVVNGMALVPLVTGMIYDDGVSYRGGLYATLESGEQTLTAYYMNAVTTLAVVNQAAPQTFGNADGVMFAGAGIPVDNWLP